MQSHSEVKIKMQQAGTRLKLHEDDMLRPFLHRIFANSTGSFRKLISVAPPLGDSFETTNKTRLIIMPRSEVNPHSSATEDSVRTDPPEPSSPTSQKRNAAERQPALPAAKDR